MQVLLALALIGASEECASGTQAGFVAGSGESGTALGLGACGLSACIFPGLGFALYPVASGEVPSRYLMMNSDKTPEYQNCFTVAYEERATKKKQKAIVTWTVVGSLIWVVPLIVYLSVY